MRRNTTKIPVLPRGAELVACTFGSGLDDYLYVVLAYIPHGEHEDKGADKFVTWRCNAEVDEPQTAEGHYIHRRDKEEDVWVAQAWADFTERSKQFFAETPWRIAAKEAKKR